MDIYKDMEPPKFSEGWLSKWKARYRIKKYTLHGKAGSVDLGDEDTETIERIQVTLAIYERCDIYNMDETGLYWQKAPTTTLATEAQPGVKQNKSRIIACMCSNADGSDKVIQPISSLFYC